MARRQWNDQMEKKLKRRRIEQMVLDELTDTGLSNLQIAPTPARVERAQAEGPI